MYIEAIYIYYIIKSFYSPPKKRYIPVITKNDPFPICIYEFDMAVSMLTQEVMFPSVNTFAGELTPESLYFAVPFSTVLSVIESIPIV